MLTIHRFEVPVDGVWHNHWINGPVLHVAARRENVVEFWAQYNDTGDLSHRAFIVVGTGMVLPDVAGWMHVGSCLINRYVWHLIECRPQGALPMVRSGDDRATSVGTRDDGTVES